MRLSAILALLIHCFTLAEDNRTALRDGQVKAGALQPFQATWKVMAKGQQAGQIQSLITETLSVRKADGREAYHRLQVTSSPDGLNSALADVTFSKQDLEPLSSRNQRFSQHRTRRRLALEDAAEVGRATSTL